MGIIRKTASIATLGLVNWRSKGERLAIAETERDMAREVTEEAVTAKRRHARRAAKARTRAEKAELKALAAEKKARREKRRSTGGKITSPVDVSDAAVVAGRRARRKAKRQLRKAERAARNQVEKVEELVSS